MIDPDDDEALPVTNRPFVKPEALYPGARIRVIAPSGVFDRTLFMEGVARLSKRYDVSYSEDIFERQGYLAGSDERRARELIDALEDPFCQAILCARGGYGALRIVPQVSLAKVAKKPKLLVGFSDITALHAVWQRARVTSLHATMAASISKLDEAAFARWMRVMEGAIPDAQPLEVNVPGACEGTIMGGNLSLLHALEGTPYSANAIGKIVFLEDVGEAPYRVDRMLTTLRLSGFFDGAVGVVLGAFTKANAGPDGISVDEVLRERLADLEIPVVRTPAYGHIDDNHELPLGVYARIQATGSQGSLEFLESPLVIKES
jgi:muramoyltetrapeptide carboxypeptidase